MEDKHNEFSLPDISGVFNIDESSITEGAEASDGERVLRPKDYEPIMLTDPEEQRLTKKELKQLNAQKKAEKRAEKRKKIKKRVILALVISAVAAAAVFGIKLAVDISRRPTGEIVRSRTGAIAAHYDTKALILPQIEGQGQLKTVAVFSENDYDIYSLTKGLSAQLTIPGGAAYNGFIKSISREEPDSEVLQKIREAFPDGEYSSGINYVVTLDTDLSADGTEGVTVDVSIITEASDSAVLVPTSAVHKDGAKFYVWIYKPLTSRAEKQEVSVGIEADGMSEITKGLKTDTRVVAVFDREEDELAETMKIKAAKTEASDSR